MMSKYDPLERHLRGLESDRWDTSFAEIEAVLGFRLPASAREYPAWWANNDPGSRHTSAWLRAGWHTSELDLRGERVRFERDTSVGADSCKLAASGRDNSRFAAALAYAALIHRNQRRKGTDIPYVSHLMSVSALVMEFGGDEDLAIAGLLHDALEDCGAWHESVIRANWGDRVADIVRACTDGVPDVQGQKAPWCERKKKYLAHLETVDDAGVLLVSACDKLHNARAIAADLKSGEDVFGRFKAGRGGTLWYYAELVRIFRKRLGDGSALVRQLEAAVNEMAT